MVLRGELQTDAKNSNFEKFSEYPLYEITEYAFKGSQTFEINALFSGKLNIICKIYMPKRADLPCHKILSDWSTKRLSAYVHF